MNNQIDIDTVLKKWKQLREERAVLEEQIDILNDSIDSIEESVLVRYMDDNKIGSLKTSDGTSIKVDRFVNPKIKEGMEENFFTYLDRIGYGSIIKQKFDFDKGQDLDGLKLFLEDRGIYYKEDKGVHYQTLRKSVADILEAEEMKNPDIKPEDIFPESLQLNIFRKAVIKGVK